MRAYIGISCRDVAENIISAGNNVKLLSSDHLFAEIF
jgi:hypothetical protein